MMILPVDGSGGKDQAKRHRAGCFVLAGSLGLAGSLALLWWGMRGVMDLGGFVASGGPYAIAHQAPEWIWIMPVSIFSGLLSVLFCFIGAASSAGRNPAPLAWPVLFASLGWNFLEYALTGERLAIGWLVCGIVFFPLAVFPVLAVLRNRRWQAQYGKADSSETATVGKSRAFLFLQLIVSLAGIVLATVWFRHLAGR